MENTVLYKLLESNKVWANNKLNDNKDYFKDLAKGQEPQILWIGCSDSRVSATEIINVHPGEMFVHRNIANMVVHTDLNLLSVLEYAVKVLKIKHIIVCGHYECGGVKAAMSDNSFGIIDNWIRNIKDVYKMNKLKLDAIKDDQERFNHFVELNVLSQVQNIRDTSIINDALANNQTVTVHGWVFDIHKGLIKELS